jgi:branched-chain amino acid transport system permease protein
MSGAATLPARRFPWGQAIAYVVVLVVLVLLPFQFPSFRVEQFTTWIAIAIAACGLNLLTGFNGQISVGHGALYGIGAYTTAILISDANWPFWLAMVGAAVVTFVVGVVIGLPALRIRGLYLALVTLAVGALFPLAVEQFSGLTGGPGGKVIETPQEYRGMIVDRRIRFEGPFGLASDQWRYLMFLTVAVVCFVLTRNLVRSRTGRALVAVRDNETAAAVAGIPTSTIKILTFGISSALAGIGGAVFALNAGEVRPSSFTIFISINFLVAVVVGGAASIVGPAIGAAFYGVFTDLIAPELPDRVRPAQPVILGALLIVLMLTAPGGVVGMYRSVQARIRLRRGRRATAAEGAATGAGAPAGAEQARAEQPGDPIDIHKEEP